MNDRHASLQKPLDQNTTVRLKHSRCPSLHDRWIEARSFETLHGRYVDAGRVRIYTSRYLDGMVVDNTTAARRQHCYHIMSWEQTVH